MRLVKCPRLNDLCGFWPFKFWVFFDLFVFLLGQILNQVIATKTKIFIVMEYVSGGQLSDKFVSLLYLESLELTCVLVAFRSH